MEGQGLLRSRRFVIVASLMVFFSLITAVGRILVREDQQATTLINDAASVSCALIATLLFIRVWHTASSKDVSKRIWGLVTIGMVSWLVAESIWGFYEVILGQNIPYPSIADLFWLFGYIPFYAALVIQYRIFQTTPTQRQKLIIAVLTIVFALAGSLLVLKPIVESFDPGKVLESLLNVAYPLFDLILLILTVVIVFAVEQGRFSFTWRLLSLGLVLMSLGDIMFAYTSTVGTYSPQGGLNAITLLIDTLYYVSYLTLGLGAYTYLLISESQQLLKINLVLLSDTITNILVFMDRQGGIISFSDNFLDLVGSQSKEQYIKMPLDKALNIDKAIIQDLAAKTTKQGSLSTQPLTIRDVDETSKDIWVTSFVITDEDTKFVCIALVLRTTFALKSGQERPLSIEQKSLIDHYLTKAGTYRSEENLVIKSYFLEQVSLLYSLIQQYSGAKAADKLFEHLAQVASENHLQFTFTGRDIGVPEEYEGQTLADQLSILLQKARNFAANMTNLKVVEREVGLLDKNLSPDNLQYIDKYSLRSIAKSAS